MRGGAVGKDVRVSIEVSGLVVRYGGSARLLRPSLPAVTAVAGIDFRAEPGSATALLGRNGAGKSTTMRVLGGVVPPTGGSARVAGHDVAQEPMAVKRAVGFCPDQGGVIPRATPWEHLQLAARLRRCTDWEGRAEQLLDRFELAGVAHRVAGGFSHGMSRRLSVVLAVFHRPQVLLLDEPFDGVDPLGVEATVGEIADAVARGATVVVSTHLRELATACCDRAIVLRGGAEVATRPASELAGEEGGRVYRSLLE